MMKIPKVHHYRSAALQKGFTIVELMIATLVFSVILLIITFGVIQFSHDFYRGINSSTTQDIVRSVSDSVTQAIQFSGSTIQQGSLSTGSGQYVCTGNQEFIYTLGTEITASGGQALIQLPIPSGNCYDNPSVQDPADWAKRNELLQPYMRLLKFSVAQVGTSTVWQVDVKVAYGDIDLLCDANTVGSCTSSSNIPMATLISPTAIIHCKPQTGSQFCDVSDLKTVAQVRVNATVAG